MSANQKTSYGAAGSLNALTFDPDELVLVTEKDHPLYDERVHDPLDEALVKNIMHMGVIQPIVIVRDWNLGKNLVAAGRQRVKNAREANRRLRERGEAPILVPAMIRKDTDGGATLAALAVSENELRREDAPSVKVLKMQRLQHLGHDNASIALHFGVNVKTVENYLALTDCSPVVRKAVDSELIGISDVKYLSRLKPEQQSAKVEEIVRNVVGKEGHARAKAKREVLQRDNPKATAPRIKTRAQIEAEWHDTAAKVGGAAYMAALEWVLGYKPEIQRDEKTRDLVDELAEGAK